MRFDAATVRTILREADQPVSSRGRVSKDEIAQSLLLRPTLARSLGKAVGVTLAERGRISQASVDAIAEAVSL